MKKLASLLLLLLFHRQVRIHNCQNANFDMNEFKEAVVQAYNASKPFSQNFYELLGLICPESVYCQTNGTFDMEDTAFRYLETDKMIDTEGFLQNYDQTAISEARIFLLQNRRHLQGCCEPCSCSNYCRERENCCPSIDASITYQEGFESRILAKEDCVYANIKSFDVNYRYSYIDTFGASYYMVSDCASTNASEDILMKCRSPDVQQREESTPVYSTDVQRIYKNIFCARCNNASPVSAMPAVLSINQMYSLTEIGRLPSSPDELYKMAVSRTRTFDMRFKFPSDDLDIKKIGCVYKPAYLPTDSSSCDANADLHHHLTYLFKRACEMEQHLYHIDRQVFANVFCYLCLSTFSSRKSECGEFGQANRNTQETYSGLLSGGMSESKSQPDVTGKDTSLCSCAEIYDTPKNICREILCPPGELRNGCDCVSFITNLTGMRIKLNLELRPQLPDNAAKDRFGGELQSNVPATITKAMRRFIASQFGPLTSESQSLFLQRASTTTGESILIFHYCELLILKGVQDDRKAIETMFNTLQPGFTRNILGTKMKISLGQTVHHGRNSIMTITDSAIGASVVVERLFPDQDKFQLYAFNLNLSQPLKKLVYCRRVKLDDDEIVHLYNAAEAVGWSHIYLEYVYWKEDGSMCLEDFEAAFMPDKTSGAKSDKYLTNECQILFIIAMTIHGIVF